MKPKDIQHIDLSNIRNPDFLKDLSYQELDVLSDDIAKHIIRVTAKNGGHLSSNLGVVDATIALCRVFNFAKDKLIFDVGHQCYTYKLLTGRSLERLRQKDGTAGYQDVKESIYDHFEAGHSSTSISAGLGLATARDLKKENYDVVSFIGDASIVNGLAFEGLNDAGTSKHKMIIVLNDNNMSISKPVGGLAKVFRRFSTSSFYRRSKHFFKRLMCGTKLGRKMYASGVAMKNWFKRHILKINIFDSFGFSVIGPVDGHNIKAMEKALIRAKRTDKSVVVFIKTIKGKGYKLAEDDDKGLWHGVHVFNPETGEQIYENGVGWSQIFNDYLIEVMSEHKDAVTIVPATGYGSHLSEVFAKFPDRCIDVGIAEEHAVTMAGGLSISGFHPIISIYSTFLQRAYDQVNHDLARIELDATLLIDRSGLVGKDGNSHQGIFDEAFLMGIPNTVVTMAATPEQARTLVEESFNHHGVFCIRYPRERVFHYQPPVKIATIPFGKWIKELTGSKIAIVAVGPEIEKLKELIKENDLSVTLFNAIYQKPMDSDAIIDLLSYEKIVIYDPYAAESGFAQALAAELLKHRYAGQVVIKAIPNVFVNHACIEEQKAEFSLLPEDVIKII
ncbi:MAG TPA: 1-deoxy-D-xylulose-5-phosphate synthase [Bacilli bacterium]|nr:1-deoxy-D-xylulose-5-phosphate synthase [Bacilli bacterium]HPS18709.1 1-deoxy-D-xylulose-5-phosphate synthase [Bacilli bacterium]